TRSARASSRASAGSTPRATSASISARWPRSTSRFASFDVGPAAVRLRSRGTSTNAAASAVMSVASVQKTSIISLKLYRTAHRLSFANPQEKHDVMSLFDGIVGAANEAATHDLRVGQAIGIVQAYGELIERARHEPEFVSDAAELPYPKETIKWA